MKQTSFLKNQPSAYGGELLKTREGRSRPRPLSTRHTLHLVLRSSRAKGEWSFKRPGNEKEIQAILARFSARYGVRILSLANVGNHLHFQLKLSNRHLYRPFIRAITSAIAMAVTGTSRWKRSLSDGERFWDYRPFTRIVKSLQAFLNLRDYIRINQLEGYGYQRDHARWIIEQDRRSREWRLEQVRPRLV